MFSRLLYFCIILTYIFDSEVSAQIFDAEVIRYNTLCEVRKDRLIQTDSVTLQINNRVGEKYTEISIPYSKSEKISDLDAWIENMDGTTVRVLKKSDVVDKSAISDISLYEDNYNRCFQLKHNTYPYRVIYTYKSTYKDYITIAWWTPMLYGKLPTRNAKLEIILPKNFPFSKYVNNISKYKVDSTEANVHLLWLSTDNKPVKSEIFSQPEDIKPYVIIAPLYFQYGVEGSTKDWPSFGNWQYRLMQDLDILPDDEKKSILTLVNGITDKAAIVKILYHYLQDHTRYINVSIGIGGLKPYPASYVAQNKYGDCKALTNYMKAMLSFVGIESFYTIVYASEQPHKLIKDYAGPQFNHVVLAVPVKNDTIWLENTMNNNPFGCMGTFTQNRTALLVCKDQSKLVQIPALKMKDNLAAYKLEFDLNTNGNAKVKLNITFKGKDFEVFNQLHSEFNDDEKDKIIRDYMPFDNYEVLNWDLRKLHRDTARIELNAELSLSKFLKPLGNEYYLSLYPSRIPSFSIPSNRTLPVVFPYPICNSDTLIYNLPIGYELKTIIEPVFLESKFGVFVMASNFSNGKLYITKKIELFSGSYSIEQYPAFYAFIQSIKNIERRSILFKSIN